MYDKSIVVIIIESFYQYNVQAIDPNNDPLTYSVINAPSGLTIDQQGIVRWTPTSEQFGLNEFTLLVDDGRGGIAPQDVTVYVVSTTGNNSPIITSDPESFSATVGVTYRYQATAIDPDNDSLLWQLENAPSGMIIDRNTGEIIWTPTVDQIGNQEVEIIVVDTQGGFARQGFTLTTTGINQAPQIVSIPITRTTVDNNYTYNVVAQDPEGDAIRYELINAPAGMTIDNSTGEINWIADATQVGNNVVTILATDANGASNTQTFDLQTNPNIPNQSPEITSIPRVTTTTGGTNFWGLIRNIRIGL